MIWLSKNVKLYQGLISNSASFKEQAALNVMMAQSATATVRCIAKIPPAEYNDSPVFRYSRAASSAIARQSHTLLLSPRTIQGPVQQMS